MCSLQNYPDCLDFQVDLNNQSNSLSESLLTWDVVREPQGIWVIRVEFKQNPSRNHFATDARLTVAWWRCGKIVPYYFHFPGKYQINHKNHKLLNQKHFPNMENTFSLVKEEYVIYISRKTAERKVIIEIWQLVESLLKFYWNSNGIFGKKKGYTSK